jgi:hypothetical protein
LWVALILSGSILATLYPAWRANRMTTRDALAMGEMRKYNPGKKCAIVDKRR